MSEHSKFTNIGQFRQVVQNVKRTASFKGLDKNGEPIYAETYTLPTINFYGTVKLHGTCSGVSMDHKGEMLVLSRKNIIDINHDNAGFAAFVKKNENAIKDLFKPFKNCLQHNEKVVIYGEWCGKGIQKGVTINQLEKMWVIFAVKIVPFKNDDQDNDSSYYVACNGIRSKEDRIFNIEDFQTFSLDIDFNRPDIANNKMIELVNQVEQCCPVGKYFGVEGVGEGIVWSSWENGRRVHIFKTKGEKHAKSSGSRVKTLKPVNEEFEQKKRDFVNNYACQEFRLDQIYNETFDLLNGGQGDIRKTGDYIRNVMKDVIKEESDMLVQMGLCSKDVTKLIASVAREYMLDRLDKEAGI